MTVLVGEYQRGVAVLVDSLEPSLWQANISAVSPCPIHVGRVPIIVKYNQHPEMGCAEILVPDTTGVAAQQSLLAMHSPPLTRVKPQLTLYLHIARSRALPPVSWERCVQMSRTC